MSDINYLKDIAGKSMRSIATTAQNIPQDIDNAILPIGTSAPARIAENTLSTTRNLTGQGVSQNDRAYPPPGYNEALQNFTPDNQKYLKQIQFRSNFLPASHGYEHVDPAAMTYGPGSSVFPGGIKPQTTIASNIVNDLRSGVDPGSYEKQIITTELLHSVPKPIGFNGKNFMQDLEKLKNQDPAGYTTLKATAQYFKSAGVSNSDIADEVYGAAGAHYKRAVFYTPIGKYYENVLKK